MRIKLPFLVGVVAFALAGNAVAGQALFTSFASLSSSSSKASSTRQSKTSSTEKKPANIKSSATYKVGQTSSSKIESIPAASGSDKISGETSTKNPNDGFSYSQTINLPTVAENHDEGIQTFSDSSHTQNDGSSGGKPAGGSDDGHAGQDASDTFIGGFENLRDDSSHNDDTTGYFNCSITAAVPEPNEWLLMLLGFGLVWSITTLHKQEIITT